MTKYSLPDEIRGEDQIEATSLIEALWSIKDAWIEGEYLVAYQGFHEGESVRLTAQTSQTMLSEFLGLMDASDEIIKNYAQKWGLLGLCIQHSLPFTHAEGCYWKVGTTELYDKEGDSKLSNRRVRTPVYEPLAAWRGFARKASAIINLAKNLKGDEPGDPNDWATLGEDFILNFPAWMIEPRAGHSEVDRGMTPQLTKRERVRVEQGRLGSIVSDWLVMAGTIPRFQWRYARTDLFLSPRISLAPLFNAIIVQIMLFINGTPGWASCANCGRLILLRKGQILSRRAFCLGKQCGKKAVNREAARRKRLIDQEFPDREKRKAKLTPAQVKEFKRQVHAAKKREQPLRPLISRCAIKYKVSESLLYKIKEGKTRSNI